MGFLKNEWVVGILSAAIFSLAVKHISFLQNIFE